MEELRIFQKPELKDPVMIAGWPGMGNVALGAIDYLRRKLNAVKFAEIILDKQFLLDAVVVEKGVASFTRPPKNSFYYTRNPDLIIFESEVQVPGEQGVHILNRVLTAAADLNVKRIFTGAALPVPASFNDEPEVTVAVNMVSLRTFVEAHGLCLMDSGHIAGLNGLLLGFAQKRGMEALCLLATMPQYALTLPNPKGSLAIIEALGKILRFRVDPEEMKDFIHDIDEKMAMIEDKVRDVFVGDAKESDAVLVDKKVPQAIIDKIERLFGEAKANKDKAFMLKNELDRWNLFGNYEDRFLDLFA